MSPKFELKAVKTFTGREGGGFEATLYRDGKRVGRAWNDANGGESEVFFDVSKPNETNEEMRASMRKLNDEFSAFATALCESKGITVEKFYPAVQVALDEMVDAYLLTRQLRRWCRRETVFKLKGDPEQTWRTIKAPYSVEVADHLLTKYGDKLDRVANEEI